MTRDLARLVNSIVFLLLVICVCLFLSLIGYLIFHKFMNMIQVIYIICFYLVGLSLMIVGFYKLRYYLHSKIQKTEVTSNRKPYMVPIMLILLGIVLIILPNLPKPGGHGCVIGATTSGVLTGYSY